MDTGAWWQVLRLPVLLALLVGVGQYQLSIASAWRQWDVGGGAAPWFATVLIGIGFVFLAIVARSRGPVRVMAAIEVVLASILVFVPPMQWGQWFEFNWFNEFVGVTTGNAFVPGLAVAWLVIAARSLVLGSPEAADDQPNHNHAASLEG